MTNKADEGELWFGRFNVSLARSHRLLQSWLPESNKASVPTAGDDDGDDGDFSDAMGELGGLESNAARKGEDFSGDAFSRRRLSPNDKLLEQLIGRKAAQAHKKSMQRGKSMSASMHAAAKPLMAHTKHQAWKEESEEDEEEGRAATFASRRTKKRVEEESTIISAEREEASDEDMPDVAHAEPSDLEESSITVPKKAKSQKTSRGAPTSYLDEILAKRARKGRRKKQRQHKSHSDAP